MLSEAVIIAIGLNTLQFVDMRSFRNMFVLGAALFFGVSIPQWVSQERNKEVFQTGN